ncbi:hypothetical protein Plhal304r1_c013g0050221 [Plasmopara halstedii]
MSEILEDESAFADSPKAILSTEGFTSSNQISAFSSNRQPEVPRPLHALPDPTYFSVTGRLDPATSDLPMQYRNHSARTPNGILSVMTPIWDIALVPPILGICILYSYVCWIVR